MKKFFKKVAKVIKAIFGAIFNFIEDHPIGALVTGALGILFFEAHKRANFELENGHIMTDYEEKRLDAFDDIREKIGESLNLSQYRYNYADLDTGEIFSEEYLSDNEFFDKVMSKISDSKGEG